MFEELDYEAEAKNGMGYWFPLLKQIRMRVPKTIFVHTGDVDLEFLTEQMETPKGFSEFITRLTKAINEIGTPCFLRTAMTSDKHSWKDSCFIESTDREYLISHLGRIVETSIIANIGGLPFDYSIWAVRELIPTKPLFYAFSDMPITRERRVFINKGKIVCSHSYWPKKAFQNEKAKKDYKKNAKELNFLHPKDLKEIELMAEYIGKYFKSYWSVDFLQDKNGLWWVTDMAIGERSYHHPECKLLPPSGN